MGHSQPIRKNIHLAGTALGIPDKLYFRIGEVARLCDVPTYVLRFWESEFPQLKPNKGGTGQRLYRRGDVEIALRVKELLKGEGYTISGARQMLKSELRQKQAALSLLAAEVPDASQWRSVRRELAEIAAMLSRPIGETAIAPKFPSKSRLQSANGSQTVASRRGRDRASMLDSMVPAAPSATVAPALPRGAERNATGGLLFDTLVEPPDREGDRP